MWFLAAVIQGYGLGLAAVGVLLGLLVMAGAPLKGIAIIAACLWLLRRCE